MIRNAIHLVETNEEIKMRLLGIPKISRDVRVRDVKLGQRVPTRRHTFCHEQSKVYLYWGRGVPTRPDG